MAVRGVHGEQGGGKTYWLVSEILRILRKGERTVCCNLPLNVEKWRELGFYVVDCNNDEDRAFLRSMPTTTKKILVGRDYVETSAVLWGDNPPDIILLAPDQIIRFFEVGPSGTDYFLDELYQHIGTQSVMKEDKAILTSYMFQPRHFDDTVSLVTHDPKNVDATIRRALTEQHWFYNSLRRVIWKKGIFGTLFAGLTWPKQFFIREVHLRNRNGAESVEHIHPESHIFELYNSFAQADLLAKGESSRKKKHATEFDWFAWLGRWLESSWLAWCATFTLVGGVVWFAVNGKNKLAELTSPASKKKKTELVASADGSTVAVTGEKETVQELNNNDSEQAEEGQGDTVPAQEIEDPSTVVVWASSRALAFKDGSKWRVGDSRGRAVLDSIDARGRRAVFTHSETGERWSAVF